MRLTNTATIGSDDLTVSGACRNLGRGRVARYAPLKSMRKVFHGDLRELPDRPDDAQNKDRINYGLEKAATFFFGAY